MSPFRETAIARTGDYLVVGGRLHLPRNAQPIHLADIASYEIMSRAPRPDKTMMLGAALVTLTTSSIVGVLVVGWETNCLDVDLGVVIFGSIFFGAIGFAALLGALDELFDRYVRRHGFTLALQENGGRAIARLRFATRSEAENVGRLVMQSRGDEAPGGRRLARTH